jgi:transposase
LTGEKRVCGRKRFVAVDSLGLIWALLVTTADVQERDGGCWLLDSVRGRLPRVREVIADRAYTKRFVEFVKKPCRWRVTIPAKVGGRFVVQPRRWVVERTFAWMVRYRRLAVDYEYLPETSEAVVYATMIHRMLRRLQPDHR